MSVLTLWSLRESIAWGWIWKRQRDVYTEDASAWISNFKKDEPNVFFVASAEKPKAVDTNADANAIISGERKPSYRKKAVAATAVYS